MDEVLFFWQLLVSALPAAIALTMVIMTIALIIRNHGGEIVRYIGRLIKWSIMMVFGEPEVAKRVKKSWRDQQNN